MPPSLRASQGPSPKTQLGVPPGSRRSQGDGAQGAGGPRGTAPREQEVPGGRRPGSRRSRGDGARALGASDQRTCRAALEADPGSRKLSGTALEPGEEGGAVQEADDEGRDTQGAGEGSVVDQERGSVDTSRRYHQTPGRLTEHTSHL